jgi:cysteine desulfurase
VPHVKLNGPEPGPERMPNNLNLSVEFVEGEGLALMLDVRGVAVASGAACVTKSMRVPPVLAAIGLPESLAKGNVIVSFGQETTPEEVRFAIKTFAKAVADLREMSPLWEDFQAGRIRSETEQ